MPLTWAGDAQPCNAFRGREAVVFHGPECDQGAGAAKSSLAVDGNTAFGCVGDGHKLIQDCQWGNRTVSEKELVMFEAGTCKAVPVVQHVVQPHHVSDATTLEVVEVVLRCKERVPVSGWIGNGGSTVVVQWMDRC